MSLPQETTPGTKICFVVCLMLQAIGSPAEATPPGFVRDVVPALTKSGCNGGKCHGSFQGRGGFRLSLLGFDPAADHEALVTEARGRRVSPSAVAQSLILRKAAAAIPHGGGRRIDKKDRAWKLLHDWVHSGAQYADSHLSVDRLIVEPAAAVLKRGEDVSIRVRAVWSDGQTTDATPWALYEVRDDSLADVDPHGTVRATRPGRTAVTVTFMGQVSAVTVTTPFASRLDAVTFTAHNEYARFCGNCLSLAWC